MSFLFPYFFFFFFFFLPFSFPSSNFSTSIVLPIISYHFITYYITSYHTKSYQISPLNVPLSPITFPNYSSFIKPFQSSPCYRYTSSLLTYYQTLSLLSLSICLCVCLPMCLFLTLSFHSISLFLPLFFSLSLHRYQYHIVELHCVTLQVKNGRMAMLAITAYAAQEYLSGMPVVQQTPFFFGDPIN